MTNSRPAVSVRWLTGRILIARGANIWRFREIGMLDIDITLLFQLFNFLIAIIGLNLLLIRPVRDIIRRRNSLMDNLAGEADDFESRAVAKLAAYEAELDKARRAAGLTREEGRSQGLAEQLGIVGDAQKSASEILAENRATLRGQAEQALTQLRNGISDFSARIGDRLLGVQ